MNGAGPENKARVGNCGRKACRFIPAFPHVFRPEVMALCQTYDIRFSPSSSLENWLAATARASMVSAMGIVNLKNMPEHEQSVCCLNMIGYKVKCRLRET